MKIKYINSGIHLDCWNTMKMLFVRVLLDLQLNSDDNDYEITY